MLLITMMSTKIILNLPRTLSEDAGSAGWILAVYITVIAFIGLAVIARLYKQMGKKDLIDVAEDVFGSTGRIIMGVIIMVFLLVILSVVMREFGEDMKTIGLTASPLPFVMLFFAVGMAMAAYFGIEAIARVHSIFLPVAFSMYIFYIILLAKYFDFSRIMPLFGNGLNSIFVKGALRTGEYGELLFLFLLLPFVKKANSLKKIGYWSMTVSGFIYFSITLVYLLIYQYPVAIENFLPVYQLGRLISYGRFFHRIESVFLIIWSAAGFLYLGTGVYFLLVIFKKTFRLKFNKPLILSFITIIFSLALVPTSLISTIDIETNYIRKWAWVLTFAITILVLAAANIVKKKRKGII
jgi:spore germination protein (amino acid permease)